jgi:hypothetical protein
MQREKGDGDFVILQIPRQMIGDVDSHRIVSSTDQRLMDSLTGLQRNIPL